MGFWLIGWAFGEITAVGVFVGGKDFGGPSLFLLAWLGGWTIGGAWAMYTLFWQLSGKEILEITSQSITTSRVVLGFGFPKEYSAEHIKDLRISGVSRNDLFGWSRASSFWGMGDGLIAFDYGARTFRFGSGVDEAEAKQVISAIQQRFPQYRSRQVLE